MERSQGGCIGSPRGDLSSLVVCGVVTRGRTAGSHIANSIIQEREVEFQSKRKEKNTEKFSLKREFFETLFATQLHK